MSSLGEDFPKEQARCRDLLAEYKFIGPAGTFGALIVEQGLAQADRAVMSGDVVEMIRAYENLRGLS